MADDPNSSYERDRLRGDMTRLVDALPTGPAECRRLRHLILQEGCKEFSDDDLHMALSSCVHLESAVLCGVENISDRTVVSLASTAVDLHGVDLSGCAQVTDIAVLELAAKSPLQWIRLNGVIGLTDASISSIAKTCSKLVELELCDLPLITPNSVRDIFSYSRKLRLLRMSGCQLLTEKAFPSKSSRHRSTISSTELNTDKPLPPNPSTWIDEIPPLVLSHTSENLRLVDLAYCTKVNDKAVAGLVSHAPRIQSFSLVGCTLLTDRALESIGALKENLDSLAISHIPNFTDRGILSLSRSCTKLSNVDLSFCRNLTDLAAIELAGLSSLRRLCLVRVHKMTDNALYQLGEHATALESLHLSYCDRLSLDAIHFVLKRLHQLQYLTTTGVSSCRRKGIERFSDDPPRHLDSTQKAVFRAFSGENVVKLRKFLDKEEQRKRDSEAKNVPFVPREDDSLDLY